MTNVDTYEGGYRTRVAGFVVAVAKHYTGENPLNKSDDWFAGFNDAEDDLRWRAQGVEQMQFGL
jgi:hypothetical protein